MAVSESTQLEPGPWQSTKLTVTPSVGWLSGSHVTVKSLPWVTESEVSGVSRGPQVWSLGWVKADANVARPAATKRVECILLAGIDQVTESD